MCSKRLKIFCMALALLLLVLLPTYSLDEAEAQELTQILTELNSGLTKVESGLNEIESGQKTLEKELNVVSKQAKELSEEQLQQKKDLAKLEARLQNLNDSYEEIERENRLLKWMVGGASAVAIVSLFVAAF